MAFEGHAGIQSAETLSVLLGRVANGDRGAFHALYGRTGSKLFGVALALLRRRDVAEDVLQEAYLRIWKNAGQYRADRGSAMTWMIAIVRNLAIDRLRYGRTDRCLEEVGDTIAADLPDPIVALTAREDEARLARAIAGLDPARRALLVAAYVRGESREELATRFGAPVSTIKTWLRRTVIDLRATIETEQGDYHPA